MGIGLEELRIKSLKKSLAREKINIKDNYTEIVPKDEKAKEKKDEFEITANMCHLGFSEKVLKIKNDLEVEEPVVEEQPVETPVVEAAPVVEQQPLVEQPVVPEVVEQSPVVEETPTKELQTINEDVIGKAKEIISIDIPSGSVILDEYLKTHDPDTNKNLLDTLIYIDPIAISNNISNEVDYLRARGINVAYVQTEEQVEEQGRGR